MSNDITRRLWKREREKVKKDGGTEEKAGGGEAILFGKLNISEKARLKNMPYNSSIVGFYYGICSCNNDLTILQHRSFRYLIFFPQKACFLVVYCNAKD